jgi:hypothetical protein
VPFCLQKLDEVDAAFDRAATPVDDAVHVDQETCLVSFHEYSDAFSVGNYDLPTTDFGSVSHQLLWQLRATFCFRLGAEPKSHSS